MFVAMFKMIRTINRDPGPEGRIPLYALLLRTTYMYHPIQRYRAKWGVDSVYRSLQFGWLLFGVGIAGVVGTSIMEKVQRQ